MQYTTSVFISVNCGSAIISLAEVQRPALEKIDKEHQDWNESWRVNKLEPDWRYDNYTSRMEDAITDQIKNFIFQIVEFGKFEYLDRKHLKNEPR